MEIPHVSTSIQRAAQPTSPVAAARPLTAQGLPTLELGQQLIVRIAQQLAPNHFVVDLNGVLVDAVGPEALKGRSVLPVLVEQTQPQLVLQVLNQQQGLERLAAQVLRDHLLVQQTAGESAEALRGSLTTLRESSDRASLPRAVLRLQATLESRLSPQAAANPETIVTQLRDGGLNYEAEVARLAANNPDALRQVPDQDLKGLLMRVHREVLSGAETAELRQLLEPVVNQLIQIESQQLLNFLAHFNGTAYEFQVPFYGGQTPSTVYLSIDPDEQGGTSDEPRDPQYNVLLMLDLETLGKTRIDGHIGKDTIRVIFYVEQAEAVERLRGMLPELESALQGLGFDRAFLAAEPLRDLSPEKREQFRTMTAGLPEGVNLVNERG